MHGPERSWPSPTGAFMALAYLSVHVECGEVGERVHVLTHSCMVLLIKIMIMSFFEIHTEMRISIAICDPQT